MKSETGTDIVTLQLDDASQAFFETMRKKHFPAERNVIGAHLTLFHTLPRVTQVAETLREAAETSAGFEMEVTGLRSLGRGVAYTFRSSELTRLHGELARQFWEHLTAQDRPKFSPHVVIQNKAKPEQARALLAELQAEFVPLRYARQVWSCGIIWVGRGSLPGFLRLRRIVREPEGSPGLSRGEEDGLRRELMLILQAQAAPLDLLLDRIVANVQEQRRTLPSITAEEAIQSDLMQHGLYRAHGTAIASLRVSATSPEKQLDEARTYKVLDGKTVPPDKKVTVPFELNGAFSRIAETFTPAHVLCYTFTLLPDKAVDGSGQMTFQTSANLPPDCANGSVVVTGLVRFDPATAQIRHLERTVTSPILQGGHEVTLIAVDYAQAAIGEQNYWLPKHLSAELDHGKGHFSADYSGFHRYAGSLTILPVSGEPVLQ